MLNDTLKHNLLKLPWVRYTANSNYGKLFRINTKYLEPLGYLLPYPANRDGDALPWFTYPAIIFLENVIQKHWKVFEYGSGYSTVFWNRKCEKTVSVEHDEYWFNQLRNLNPAFEIHLAQEKVPINMSKTASDFISAFEAMNFKLPICSDQNWNIEHGLLNIEFSNYAAYLLEFPKGFFDVIVVDGMARSLCLFLASEWIAENGIIILDNSDRWQYNSLQEYLIKEKNFVRIDFSGLGPINSWGWTTSIFFKNLDFLRNAQCGREQGAGDLGW